MVGALEQDIEAIRNALLELNPTGANGFEGLLATILTKITGHTFRLAGSGSQHGIDGEGIESTTSLTFEGKLYKNDIPPKELFSKMTEIIARNEPPDLWIVGATVEVKTQISSVLREAAGKSGICTLELDWAEAAPIPPLAIACAIAEDEAARFLKDHIADAAKADRAEQALQAVCAHADFETLARKIREALEMPTTGHPIALQRNRQWLREAFADKKRARQLFGQSLAPNAEMAIKPLKREDLWAKVAKEAFGSSDGRIVAISGTEGTGKSWLFAQSWLAHDNPPLTVLVSAADLRSDIVSGDIREFLVRELIKQTGDRDTPFSRARWQQILNRWEAADEHKCPNIVVCIDGLNQQPDFVWPRWLDGLSSDLEHLGGTLVISTRPSHFTNRLQGNMLSPITTIGVNEWSDAELGELLQQRKIQFKELPARVVKTLKNPRVLGIAFELLDSESIRAFEELSVERLLFEHIRKSAQEGGIPEQPHAFMKRLSSHADEVTSRVRAQRREDQLVFENADFAGAPRYELSSDLLAVSEGRFFQTLSDDVNRYQLTDDGLVLALGFSILEALRRCVRNGNNVGEELDILLEPIGALDKTAEAVFAALLVASVDDKCADPIPAALISAYLRLQNIDQNSYPAFDGVVRNAIEASMVALRELSTSPAHVEHMDWLTSALYDNRQNDGAWTIMSTHIHEWLKRYTLDPSLKLHNANGRSAAEIAKERAEREQELKDRLAQLSEAEAAFLANNLTETDRGASPTLSKHAFTLMTGMPLEPFGGTLVAWSFSQQLNSDFHAPYDEFMFLIRFNTADWKAARTSILANAEFLRAPDVSRTGKWTLVHILRATAAKDDAVYEHALVEELTADREHFEGWRLVEKYCATDPCDPEAERPDNIEKTSQRYLEIQLDKVRASRCMGAEDHFLEDARPGLARFKPETDLKVSRDLIEHQLEKLEDMPFFQLAALREMSALVSTDQLPKLKELAQEKSVAHDRDDTDSRNSWVTSQYALLTMFPHLSGSEQLETITSLPECGSPLLDLADVLKPCDPPALEQALDRAAQTEDSNFQLTVLMFARYSETELTTRSLSSIRALAESPKSSVRAQAMSVLGSIEDIEGIKHHARSHWSAGELSDREHYFERWYGGGLLAQAVANGLIEIGEALERIAPEHHWFLAGSGKAAHQIALANQLDASVQRMIEVELPSVPPLVEQNIAEDRKAFEPPLLSLADEQKNVGIDEFFKRMNESDDDFDARQKRGWEAFGVFEKAVSKEQARTIIEHSNATVIRDCVAGAPEVVTQWAHSFLKLPKRKVRRVYNFALLVAQVLSETEPKLARELFDHLKRADAYVRTVSGIASIPIEALSVWRSADTPELNALRAERLDLAVTDQAIATEVLAANMAGKQAFLDDYTESRLARDEPVFVARALMVLGFGIETERADHILSQYRDEPGLAGDAAKAALYAYERNRWSRHWFTQMCETDKNEEFWRFSSLFLKIVDARYELWSDDMDKLKRPAQEHLPSLRRRVERRIKKWQNEREKKLFGYKAPGPIFVENP